LPFSRLKKAQKAQIYQKAQIEKGSKKLKQAKNKFKKAQIRYSHLYG
jgi:hypothetical protein